MNDILDKYAVGMCIGREGIYDGDELVLGSVVSGSSTLPELQGFGPQFYKSGRQPRTPTSFYIVFI